MRDAGSQAIGYDPSFLYRSAHSAVEKYRSVQQVAPVIVPEERREAGQSAKMPLHSALPLERLVPEWPGWPNRSYQLAEEAASQAARSRVAVEAQTPGEVVAVPCSEEKEEQKVLR
jgi:hypothetical protein